MNIKVIGEEDPNFTFVSGGECAVCDLTIYVSNTLDARDKREVIIHAVIENYCRSWPHDKVNQLTEFIQDALD